MSIHWRHLAMHSCGHSLVTLQHILHAEGVTNQSSTANRLQQELARLKHLEDDDEDCIPRFSRSNSSIGQANSPAMESGKASARSANLKASRSWKSDKNNIDTMFCNLQLNTVADPTLVYSESHVDQKHFLRQGSMKTTPSRESSFKK
jgi:hypothetical protein